MEETGIMNGEKNSRRKAQLPRPVYELLPYLYLLMALSLLLLFDDITRLSRLVGGGCFHLKPILSHSVLPSGVGVL
jgi:hypothetical protein